MHIASQPYKKLLAINHDGTMLDIPNMIMRKPMKLQSQHEHIRQGSLVITCSYFFKEHTLEWSDRLWGICHPFKESFFPEHLDQFLLSESDFCDRLITMDIMEPTRKKYDFFCFTIDSEQGVLCKGSYLLPMIDAAAQKARVKGILIDYSSKIEQYKHSSISVQLTKNLRRQLGNFKNIKFLRKLMKPSEVCRCMKQCYFGLFPNNRDASPRLLAECILRGVPALVNSSIYGGWKYINDRTGLFFDAPPLSEYAQNWSKHKQNDFIAKLAAKMTEMRSKSFSGVSQAYYEKYGFINSGMHLAAILNSRFDTNYRFVAYQDFKKTVLRNIHAIMSHTSPFEQPVRINQLQPTA